MSAGAGNDPLSMATVNHCSNRFLLFALRDDIRWKPDVIRQYALMVSGVGSRSTEKSITGRPQ